MVIQPTIILLTMAAFFERRQAPESRNFEMTASEWAKLVGLFEKSGFWQYVVDDGFGMPPSIGA